MDFEIPKATIERMVDNVTNQNVLRSMLCTDPYQPYMDSRWWRFKRIFYVFWMEKIRRKNVPWIIHPVEVMPVTIISVFEDNFWSSE